MPETTTTGTHDRIETPEARNSAWSRDFPSRKALDAGIVIAAAIAAAILLRTFVAEAILIPTPSMEPSLLPGDFVVVSKLAFPRVEAGGVYAFGAPTVAGAAAAKEIFVKRCVGVPGDTVDVADGLLRVNGRRLRTGEAGPAALPEKLARTHRTWVIPLPGERIPLNDSTLHLWQPLIEREGHRVARGTSGEILVDGAPTTSYRISRRNYFVIGDNSADSFDSRFWGLLPESAVIGRAILIYWSWDNDRSAVRWGRVGMIVR